MTVKTPTNNSPENKPHGKERLKWKQKKLKHVKMKTRAKEV